MFKMFKNTPILPKRHQKQQSLIVFCLNHTKQGKLQARREEIQLYMEKADTAHSAPQQSQNGRPQNGFETAYLCGTQLLDQQTDGAGFLWQGIKKAHVLRLTSKMTRYPLLVSMAVGHCGTQMERQLG